MEGDVDVFLKSYSIIAAGLVPPSSGLRPRPVEIKFIHDIDIADILEKQRSFFNDIAAEMDVAPGISPDDMLFDFLIRAVFLTDYQKAAEAYFTGGRSCAQRFAALCREHLQSDPKAILEFASGYGRVSRHAKHVLPATSWTCSDVHPRAVEFNAHQFGLDSFISPSRLEAWNINRKFDVSSRFRFSLICPIRLSRLGLNVVQHSGAGRTVAAHAGRVYLCQYGKVEAVLKAFREGLGLRSSSRQFLMAGLGPQG